MFFNYFGLNIYLHVIIMHLNSNDMHKSKQFPLHSLLLRFQDFEIIDANYSYSGSGFLSIISLDTRIVCIKKPLLVDCCMG